MTRLLQNIKSTDARKVYQAQLRAAGTKDFAKLGANVRRCSIYLRGKK